MWITILHSTFFVVDEFLIAQIVLLLVAGGLVPI